MSTHNSHITKPSTGTLIHAATEIKAFRSRPVTAGVIRLTSMLDPDHPDTPPTFAISREDDAILSIAKRMTLVSTDAKQRLLARSSTHFTTMRSITTDHWGESKSMLDAIDLLQSDLQSLAALDSTNDFLTEWRGKLCTVCSTAISNMKGYDDMLYCPQCLKVIDDGRDAVDEAFGLWCI